MIRRRRTSGGVGEAFRRTHQEARKHSLSSATRVAEDWAAWATEQDDAGQAAEAYWQLVAATPRDSAARLFRSDKERVIRATQGTAAEAGWWLIRARRPRDAAVAIELSRAVLLTDAVQRERVGLRRLLAEAGRDDLYTSYQRAAGELTAVERGQLEDPMGLPAARAIVFEGRVYEAAFSSTAQEAWSEHDRVVREIARVLRLDHVEGPPTYEHLQAAAGDGPVVYLAAAERGGYGLVVSRRGPPLPIDLPDLTAAAVQAYARQFVDAAGAHHDWWPGVLADTLTWLWAAAMAEVVGALPRGSLVTLVPVGALGLLPLHAAGAHDGSNGTWGYADEFLVVRYAPNARVLLGAQEQASRPRDRPLRALAVSAPDAEGHPTLRHSTAEALAIAERFGPAGTMLRHATHDQVVCELPEHEVWHFACHGRAIPEAPLESAVLLTDGPLTLRQVVARPAGRQRLAVLSACDTNLPDPELLDEVVSLPGGLLQAGVAGVVASHWKVDDRAAMLLVLRFYERWSAGLPPPQALAEAQAWLRTSTNGSLQASLPHHHPAPAGLPPEALRDWSSTRPFEPPQAWAAFSYTGA